MVVRRPRHAEKDAVKAKCEQADHRLRERVPEQRRAYSLAPPPDQERANRHPAEENDEDDDLRVRAMADEKADVTSPNGLVDQTSGA